MAATRTATARWPPAATRTSLSRSPSTSCSACSIAAGRRGNNRALDSLLAPFRPAWYACPRHAVPQQGATMPRIVIASVALLVITLPLAADEPKPIKVLIITGDHGHAW